MTNPLGNQSHSLPPPFFPWNDPSYQSFSESIANLMGKQLKADTKSLARLSRVSQSFKAIFQVYVPAKPRKIKGVELSEGETFHHKMFVKVKTLENQFLLYAENNSEKNTEQQNLEKMLIIRETTNSILKPHKNVFEKNVKELKKIEGIKDGYIFLATVPTMTVVEFTVENKQKKTEEIKREIKEVDADQLFIVKKEVSQLELVNKTQIQPIGHSFFHIIDNHLFYFPEPHLLTKNTLEPHLSLVKQLDLWEIFRQDIQFTKVQVTAKDNLFFVYYKNQAAILSDNLERIGLIKLEQGQQITNVNLVPNSHHLVAIQFEILSSDAQVTSVQKLAFYKFGANTATSLQTEFLISPQDQIVYDGKWLARSTSDFKQIEIWSLSKNNSQPKAVISFPFHKTTLANITVKSMSISKDGLAICFSNPDNKTSPTPIYFWTFKEKVLKRLNVDKYELLGILGKYIVVSRDRSLDSKESKESGVNLKIYDISSQGKLARQISDDTADDYYIENGQLFKFTDIGSFGKQWMPIDIEEIF